MIQMANHKTKLVAFLNSDINERNNNLPEHYCLKSGYANGYVAVPPGHPLYAKSDLDSLLDVHGGVTFTDCFDNVKRIFKSIEYIDEPVGVTDDWWVIGFDTCHFEDSLERWPREAVVAETLRMKNQLEELCTSYDR